MNKIPTDLHTYNCNSDVTANGVPKRSPWIESEYWLREVTLAFEGQNLVLLFRMYRYLLLKLLYLIFAVLM